MFIYDAKYSKAYVPKKPKNMSRFYTIYEKEDRLSFHLDHHPNGRFIQTISFKNNTTNLFKTIRFNDNPEENNFANNSTNYKALAKVIYTAYQWFYSGYKSHATGTVASLNKLIYDKAVSCGFDPIRTDFRKFDNSTLTYLSMAYPVLAIGYYNSGLSSERDPSFFKIPAYLANKARRCNDISDFCKRLYKNDSSEIRDYVAKHLNKFELLTLNASALYDLTNPKESRTVKIGDKSRLYLNTLPPQFFKVLKYLPDKIVSDIIAPQAVLWRPSIRRVFLKLKAAQVEKYAQDISYYVKDVETFNSFLSIIEMKGTPTPPGAGIQAPVIVSGTAHYAHYTGTP